MADRKAQNKWVPPDFDPRKHGSVNGYQQSHPLRARANKLSQGILVIRFELPWNAWCLHCDKHIGMGVRYNAQKKKVGAYLSTPIWEFRMKCHLCSGWFAIRTDPQHTAYQCVEGVRRQIDQSEADARDTGQIRLDTEAAKERLAEDAFFRLEHTQADHEIKDEAGPRLLELLDLRDRQHADPYAVSQRLRQSFRQEKRARLEVERECRAIKDRNGLEVDILPVTEADITAAASIDFDTDDATVNDQHKQAMLETNLFSPALAAASSKEMVLRHIPADKQTPQQSSAITIVGQARQQTLDAELRRHKKVAQIFKKSATRSSLGLVLTRKTSISSGGPVANSHDK